MTSKIIRWAKAPNYSEDHEKSRSASLLNMILWMFIVAANLYGFLAPIDPEMRIRRVIIILPFVIVLFGLKYALNLGYIKVVGTILVASLWLMFTGAMLYGADYNNPAFMGYLVVIVTAGLVLNWRASIGWSIFSIITNAIVVTLGQAGHLRLSQGETPPFAFWAAQTVYIIVTTALLSQAIRKIDEAFEKTQHEIKERKRVESEREAFTRELEAKNAELERFTYTVSHDLKSPLITISGYLNFLEKDAHSGEMERFDKDTQRIREAVIKMQALLNDLLELSRVGRLMNPPEQVSFKKVVHDALSLVDISLQKRNIKITIQENMPDVHVDKNRIVEVIQNLVDNAIKFMGKQPNPHIEIGSINKNEETVFFIKDNGIGIDSSHHERIFGLFNKLDTESEGTGVGLALVKRTIEVHQGKIWVESNEGEGTTFYFTLPAKPE